MEKNEHKPETEIKNDNENTKLLKNAQETPATSSVAEKLKLNLGNRFKEMQKYFRSKNANEKGPEDDLKEPAKTDHQNASPSYQENPVTADEEKMKSFNENTESLTIDQIPRIDETDDALETAFENALESKSETEKSNFQINAQKRTVWETRYFSENGLHATWKVCCLLNKNTTKGLERHWKVKLKLKPARKIALIKPQPSQIDNSVVEDRSANPIIQRKFKIVLVGDSGVGKTSFIRRFCNDSFKASFHSTIGIDYQEKQVSMNGKYHILQFWDTAGQERFRSISTQYFRNSDAVIAIYDVTSETSFKNIRRWIDLIKENGVEDSIVLLIGNKTDAIDLRLDNGIKTTHGTLLAKEYGAIFFETSVKYDENVKEAVTALVKLLQKKLQKERDILALQEKPQQKKKWC